MQKFNPIKIIIILDVATGWGMYLYKKVAATKAAATVGMSARNYFVVTLMLSRYHLFWLLAAF